MPAKTQTRRGPQASALSLPDNCITASALRSLANALERFQAFHQERGGPAPDRPCLSALSLEDGRVVAHVRSGSREFRLELKHGAWELS